jgi:excisionase family DNA binding protein
LTFEEAEKAFYKHHQELGNAIVIMKAPPVVETLYSIDQAAELLRVTRRTVQGYIESGNLGCTKSVKGKIVNIKQSDLDAFLNLGIRRRTKKETSREADKILDKIEGK